MEFSDEIDNTCTCKFVGLQSVDWV